MGTAVGGFGHPSHPSRVDGKIPVMQKTLSYRGAKNRGTDKNHPETIWGLKKESFKTIKVYWWGDQILSRQGTSSNNKWRHETILGTDDKTSS